MLKIFFAGSLLTLITACSSFFYYPTRGQYYDPAKIPLKYEQIFIQPSNGKKIHAWYFPAEGVIKGTILFFHGNAENLSSHFVSLYWLPAFGYSYMIFDYPGYGESAGSPTPESTVESGKEVLKWLALQHKESPLFIYGQSLGGNIALRVALEMKDQIPLKAVIVDGSFASYKAVARSILAKHWLTWILQPLTYLVLSDKYAPDDVAKLSPIPLLVIHGEKDPVIPVEQGKKLFEKASEPKSLWILPFGFHGDAFFTENKIYRQKFLDFLQSN